MKDKIKRHSILAIALAIFVVSPLDDMVVAALFGTAFFGFGSTPFYLLLIASSTISMLIWKRHELATRLKRHVGKTETFLVNKTQVA